MQKGISDSALIESCFRLYEQRVYTIAYAVLNSQWQSEEAVQETFIKIIERRDKLRYMTEEGRQAYISKIARNVAIDMYRHNKREAENKMEYAWYEYGGGCEHNGRYAGKGLNQTEELLDDMEAKELISLTMDSLNVEDRLLLQLRIVRELSYKEMSAIMGISAITLRKRYERAIKRARRIVGKELKKSNATDSE